MHLYHTMTTVFQQQHLDHHNYYTRASRKQLKTHNVLISGFKWAMEPIQHRLYQTTG